MADRDTGSEWVDLGARVRGIDAVWHAELIDDLHQLADIEVELNAIRIRIAERLMRRASRGTPEK